MSLYPDARTLLNQPTGSTLLEVRRSLRSVFKYVFAFLFLTVAVYALTWLFGDVRPFPDTPILRHLSLRWLAILPALTLVEIVRKYHDDLYIFLDQRILHHDGRLSLSYNVPAVRYSDIRAITVYQDIFGRLLGYGNIAVGTAAQEGAELTLEGVREPKELARLLDDLRNYHRAAGGPRKTTDVMQARAVHD